MVVNGLKIWFYYMNIGFDMGRNLFGGNHKHLQKSGGKISSKGSSKVSEDKESADNDNESEDWAAVTKILGNGRVEVHTSSGIFLHAVIRNKFRGKRKGHNIISVGTFLRVGTYQWQAVKRNADVLEVFSSDDVQRLLQNAAFSEFYNRVNRTLHIFNSNKSTVDNTIQCGFDLQFTTDEQSSTVSNKIVVDDIIPSIDEDNSDDDVDIDCI